MLGSKKMKRHKSVGFAEQSETHQSQPIRLKLSAHPTEPKQILFDSYKVKIKVSYAQQ